LDGNGARFPSALIGIGVEPPKYINGVLLIPDADMELEGE